MATQRYRPTPMPGLEIQPFADDHLDAAADLLAERHARHREAEPLLPDVTDFRPHVEETWHADGASGWFALTDDEPAGYLIGSPRGEVWGEGNVWVGLAGHAVREPEIVRDLYRAAASAWVEQGLRRHYALVPATETALVDAWFRLSFGAQHAQGIQEVPAPANGVPGFVVRQGGPDDAETAARIDLMLPEYQAGSPVFGAGRPPSLEELVAEYAESLGNDEGILLVEQDGRAVGLLTVADVSRSGMHGGLSRPERAAILGFAATVPEVRGSGAGIALTNACFDWAREHGYETIVVDWRETNLLSSRFWPKRGFRRTFLRLYRSIP
jgi:ribosomal protein S18 acetylase RimI-like enzyme